MKTFTIGWLNKCRCGNKSHSVKTARGNESALWDDDAVKCNSCGRGGVIQVCEGQARVLWETDEEMAEGKPMSTITKEQAQSVSDLKAGYTLGHADVAILNELARIAMASLEAEPVAWTSEETLAEVFCDETGVIGPQYMVGNIPLYLHAQHAPVVPDEMPLHTGPREFGRPQAYVDGWNACRAAMLQGAEPVSNRDELPYAQVKAAADLYALCWQSGEVVTYTPDPEKATIWLNNYSGTCVQEYVKLERLQETLSGNSPVIPDDWVMVPKEPTQAMIKAWLSEVANWRGHVAGYKAALAAAPQHEVK